MAETFEVLQEVTVDVSKSIPAPTVFCKQADNVVRVLRVTIQDNKEDYPIPAGFAARLRGTKADGTRIYLDARSAAENVAEFILTQNALAAYGKATCEVELSNSNGDVVKSCNLVLNVQKTAMDDSAVESTDEFKSLEAAKEAATKSAADAEKAKTAAEEALEKVNSSATNAAASAKSASDAAQKIEDSAEKIDQNAAAVSQLKEDKLDKPDNPVVGQLLLVKSITDDGDIVLETVAGGGGSGLPEGGTAGQVLIKKSDSDSDAEWTDKAVVLETPITNQQDDLVALMKKGPLYIYSDDVLYTISRYNSGILVGYGPIVYSGKTFSIYTCVIKDGNFSKSPMNFMSVASGGAPGQILAKKSTTNGDTQWVDPQTATVRTAMDDVAVAGAKYFLGEQTALSITMPDDAQVGQEIMVVFSSGETACTLAVDLDDFDFVPKANSMCKIVFLCVAAETWLVDAKEG